MSLIPLVTLPNTQLHKASVDVVFPLSPAKQKKLEQLGQDMIETMLHANGIGLAGVQIGQMLNIFTVNKEVSGDDEHWVLVNPTITFASKSTNTMDEGCLSCPNQFGDVQRPEKVRVKAYTLDGKAHTFKAKGMLAKVFQHEIDHLHGTLIVDKFLDR